MMSGAPSCALTGNDRIVGGNGNDTFCLGGTWGADTIEQLAAGKVILRFESGSVANWNVSTQTCTAGNNSVTVTGTSDIELYFGADFCLPAGAFLNASGDKICENINSGMPA